MRYTLKKTLLIVDLITGLCFCSLFTVEAKTFKEPLTVTSKYFSVYTDTAVDINRLLPRLNFDYFLHPETILGRGSKKNSTVIGQTLDALYLEVSDIMDIHMYNYHLNLVIVPDRSGVNNKFRELFGRDFGERSFYLHPENTVYISAQDLTVGMLGHEISHAIQSHYFVVPPPAKIQEVLAGYVEYSLRKKMGTLP